MYRADSFRRLVVLQVGSCLTLLFYASLFSEAIMEVIVIFQSFLKTAPCCEVSLVNCDLSPLNTIQTYTLHAKKIYNTRGTP